MSITEHTTDVHPCRRRVMALATESGRVDAKVARTLSAGSLEKMALGQGWLSTDDLDYFEQIVVATSRPSRPSAHPSVRSKQKRLIDIVGALIGVLITALLTPLIALAIRIETRGPIFFRQTRCGLDGQYFQIWKFRSMVVGADFRHGDIAEDRTPGYGNKKATDCRITRVGAFLRATSLDEFPQFWNVLKGEMSLIGTRPPTPYEVAKYDDRQWGRLDVKPGISGEWQVCGRSAIDDFDEVVELDLRYRSQWSVSRDLRLLLQTVWVVALRRGAC